jgi:hypothetical protein
MGDEANKNYKSIRYVNKKVKVCALAVCWVLVFCSILLCFGRWICVFGLHLITQSWVDPFAGVLPNTKYWVGSCAGFPPHTQF